MFNNVSAAQAVFIGVGTLTIYLLILAVVLGKKAFRSIMPGPRTPSLQPAAVLHSEGKKWSNEDLLPPLIDKPADHPTERAQVYEPVEEDYASFEFREDDGSITLLKEAERIVEEIQDTVNHIASSPANPDEVKSKIGAIVSKNRIFLDTEYFDAINSFISVTLQRDCELTMDEASIKDLWTRQAA